MQTVLNRLDLDPARRAEALRDFLLLSLPDMDDAAIRAVASKVPLLPRSLYEKWISLFIDRLFETIPQDQLEDLCDGSENNNATLGMVYLLFMESARMEKQVVADLAELGLNGGANSGLGDEAGAEADALALYLKARLAQKSAKPAENK